MANVVVLVGRPGSGKSTIGRMLADRFGWQYVSTGDIARQIASEDQISDIITMGAFAPEGEMRRRVADILAGADGVVILDGMPRRSGQPEFLSHIADVLYVVVGVSSDAAALRLGYRGRQDDNERSIASRMQEFKRHTMKAVAEATNMGYTIHTVDGERPILEVVDNVSEIVMRELVGR